MPDTYEFEEFDEDDYEADYECDCCGCTPRSENIHDYDYKPEPRFFDAINQIVDNPRDGVPYLGLELEISTDDPDSGSELLTANTSPTGLIYCKTDSSVEGFEMVTHPMTLDAARQVLPFDVLDELAVTGDSAEENGIHVHVSRSGFTNDSHIFKWMKLFYRNQEAVIRIARRDPEHWGAFRNADRLHTASIAQKVRGRRKAANSFYPERYSAINACNSQTFEVRVFAGSLYKMEIMAALELVDASVEYTRTLQLAAIAAGGWEWEQFIEWANAQGDRYTNLIALDAQTQYPREKEDRERRNKQFHAAIKRARAQELREAENRRAEEKRREEERRAQIAEWDAVRPDIQERVLTWFETRFTASRQEAVSDFLMTIMNHVARLQALESPELAPFIEKAKEMVSNRYDDAEYSAHDRVVWFDIDVLEKARALLEQQQFNAIYAF